MAENPADKAKQDAMYEDKEPKKIIRLITVTAYMVSVSFVGMTLSTYYIFLWNPPNPRLMHAQAMAAHSERLIEDDGLTISRMIGDRPDSDKIDLLSTQLMQDPNDETLKSRREIVENVNAILRENFEKSKQDNPMAKGLFDRALSNDTLTNNSNTSLLLDNITESSSTGSTATEPSSVSQPLTEENKVLSSTSSYPNEPSTLTNSIHSTLPVEVSSDNLGPTISPATVLPTKWTKNFAKKQHQTPFALKHLEVPIKFDGLRKRPIRIMTTTTTTRRPQISLDMKGTLLDRTTPLIPTTESSSENPSPAYPTRSLYKTLTTPPSRRKVYEFLSSSTELPEQFPAMQRANNEDYQDPGTIVPADDVMDD